jgi:O-antigen ligase
MWLFIHRPFEVWPVLGTIHLERVYMLLALNWWAFLPGKRWVSNPLGYALGLLVGVVLLCWAASPFVDAGELTVENYLKVALFAAMMVTSIRSEKELRFIVAAFLVCLNLYMLHSYREFLNGRHVYRMGIVRMIGVDESGNDPNSFAATLLYGLPLLAPFWLELRDRQAPWRSGKRLLICYHAAMTCLCVLLTGSRQGFVGLILLGSLAVLSTRRRFAILLLAALTTSMSWLALPDSLKSRYMTLIDPSYGPKNAQASAQGRSHGWADGVNLWKQSPITGFGPGAFALARGKGLEKETLQAHHLYGQILGELGSLGVLAVGTVVLGFFANLLATRRLVATGVRRKRFLVRLQYAIAVVIALLLFNGLGSHNLYRYAWAWMGAFQIVGLDDLRRAVSSTLERHERWRLVAADRRYGVWG